MSQKTGKRSRKATDSPVVVIDTSNKETDEKPEIINTKNDLITKKDSTNSTKTNINVQETKEVNKDRKQNDNNVEKPSTPLTKEKDSDTTETSQTSIDIIETESSKKSDEINNKSSEQESLDGEFLEPLILEQTNGVEILIQSCEEVIENGPEKKDDVKEINKEKEENLKPEEKIINGGESHEFEGFKIGENSDIDGKKTYNFEDIALTNSQNENFSQTLNDLSTRAVVGSDATRFGEDFEYSKFLSLSKDQPLTESLRHLSARRSIRRNYYPAGVNLGQSDAARKRKYFDGESSEDAKRAKKDSNSSGIMSYFGYPFIKKPDASSTPKLTGYKMTTVFDNDVSKIAGLNISNEKSPSNKWCSVM